MKPTNDCGSALGADGSVKVAAAFTTVEQHWVTGSARMAELAAQLLIEDDFVGGPAAQARWRSALIECADPAGCGFCG